MLVDDAGALLGDDPSVRTVRDAITTIDVAVAELGGAEFRASGTRPLVHDHCHARALGVPDLPSALAGLTTEPCRASGAGCCGRPEHRSPPSAAVAHHR